MCVFQDPKELFGWTGGNPGAENTEPERGGRVLSPQSSLRISKGSGAYPEGSEEPPAKNWKQNGAWRVDVTRVAFWEDHFNCEEWAVEKIGNRQVQAVGAPGVRWRK